MKVIPKQIKTISYKINTMTPLIEKVTKHITDIALKNNEKMFLTEHVLFMAGEIERFAKELSIDQEMCILAVLFHDINKLEHIDEKHHIKGAKRAYDYLIKENYPEDKSQIVHDMILTHSSDKNYPPITIEQKLLYSVDGLGAFKNFFGIVYGVVTRGDLNEEAGFNNIKKKYLKAWEKVNQTPIIAKEVQKEKDMLFYLFKIKE